MNDIAEEIGRLAVSFGAPKAAVRVVSLGGQAKGDVVFFSLRQSGNCLFFVVMKDIKP